MVAGVKCQGVRFTVTVQMSVNVVSEKMRLLGALCCQGSFFEAFSWGLGLGLL